MPQLTNTQHAEIIEAITEGGDEIARARDGEDVPSGYLNFESALQILGDARGLFLGDKWPQASIEAAKYLQSARYALQLLNVGIAAPSITQAQARLELVAEQLDPDEAGLGD